MSKCEQCEELKHKIDIMKREHTIDFLETGKLIAYYSEELKRLRQILTNIKEIAKKETQPYCETWKVDGYNKILQKISECEVENDR